MNNAANIHSNSTTATTANNVGENSNEPVNPDVAEAAQSVLMLQSVKVNPKRAALWFIALVVFVIVFSIVFSIITCALILTEPGLKIYEQFQQTVIITLTIILISGLGAMSFCFLSVYRYLHGKDPVRTMVAERETTTRIVNRDLNQIQKDGNVSISANYPSGKD